MYFLSKPGWNASLWYHGKKFSQDHEPQILSSCDRSGSLLPLDWHIVLKASWSTFETEIVFHFVFRLFSVTSTKLINWTVKACSTLHTSSSVLLSVCEISSQSLLDLFISTVTLEVGFLIMMLLLTVKVIAALSCLSGLSASDEDTSTTSTMLNSGRFISKLWLTTVCSFCWNFDRFPLLVIVVKQVWMGCEYQLFEWAIINRF